MSPLVTAKMIAEKVLGVRTSSTVLRLAKSGKIPVIRLTPSLIRFDLEAVRAALQKMETPAK